MYTFSPNTKIDSSKVNFNFAGLADGTLDDTENSLETFRNDHVVDYVVSGGLWIADFYGSTLYASMSAMVAIISGKRVTVPAVTAHLFTASKDTYIYCDNTGQLTYTEVTLNAASPALPADSILICIIQTSAISIENFADINQGQPNKTKPTTCNVGKAGIDSLGNKIYNRDPSGLLVFTANGNLGTSGDVLSLTLPLLVQTRLTITGHISTECVNTPSCALYSRLYVDGGSVDEKRIDTDATAKVWTSFPHEWQADVASGSKIVKLNLAISGGGYFQYTASSLKIEARPV